MGQDSIGDTRQVGQHSTGVDIDPGRKCVAAVEFGALPKLGRLPRVHYLTKHGARYLAEAWQVDPEAIDYPKGAKLFVRDYFHRRATIDFEIELRLFAERHGAAGGVFPPLLRHRGRQPHHGPAGPPAPAFEGPLGESFFIPDAVFAVRAPDGARFLYALEMYNGMDTKRVHSKLRNHLLALGEGRLSELYGHPQAHRVLCVFESDGALEAVTQRLWADPAFTEDLRRQFAFSTLRALREDFATQWLFFEAGRATIFDLLP